MTTVIATLLVVLVVGLSVYGGARDGFFFTIYALVRNLFAFLCAMTFCEPLARVLEQTLTRSYPAHAYFAMLSFGAIFGVVFALGRWLKVHYTVPGVFCLAVVDKVVGPALGLLNGVVITGTLLILWSLMPFAKYIPGDVGVIRIQSRTLDTGAMMLRFYDHETRSIPGKGVFLLEDEPLKTDENKNLRADEGDSYVDRNNNRRWDRGWLWKYKHYGDITPGDLQPWNIASSG
jgi:uncharacterized membrane protein required for colicin V production